MATQAMNLRKRDNRYYSYEEDQKEKKIQNTLNNLDKEEDENEQSDWRSIDKHD